MSEAEVAAGGDVEGLGWSDVALDEGGEPFVAGLGGDAVEPDASDGRGGGVTIFEFARYGSGWSTEEVARGGLNRALDLTGLGVVQLRTRDLTRDDLRGVYTDLGIESVEDWSILDLLLGLVIKLSRGDLAGVVESVTNDSIPLEARPAHRASRMDAVLREWASHFEGSGTQAD